MHPKTPGVDKVVDKINFVNTLFWGFSSNLMLMLEIGIHNSSPYLKSKSDMAGTCRKLFEIAVGGLCMCIVLF